MNKPTKNLWAVLLLLIAIACENQDATIDAVPLDDSPIFMELPGRSAAARESGSQYAVLSAEYLTSEESGEIGRTIFFINVGNKKLNSDFVPGLSLDATDNVSFYVDENRPSADLAVGATSGAIVSAMQAWNGATCSDLGMFQVPSNPATTTGFVSLILGFGGSNEYAADVVHSGWLPAAFFDLLAPQGSTFILAVTFTIIFTDGANNPTDIDSNKKFDVAWREIYYNDTFTWRNGATFDVETVALHEAGHGLSQAHFGQAFVDASNGKLHFAPRAVMNASYSGVQTAIGQTDLAGHCSNWASWNNN